MWVKVCGCVEPENARAVAGQGVDAIGLNFYPGSKRFIGDAAGDVRDAIGDAAEAIGLFVDESVEAVRTAVAKYRLDSVQLHGHESAAVVAALAPTPVYRAVRVRNGAIGETIDRFVDELASAGAENVAGLLIDVDSPTGLGGTGESIDWHELGTVTRSYDGPPIVLAGGLAPDNVAEAISFAQPSGVDVASGVESKPGVKDPALVERFVAAARGASAAG